MPSKPSDPKLPFGKNFCKCAACGEYFNSEAPFAMHRRGKPDDRKCLDSGQMLSQGMAINEKGYWISRKFDWEQPPR